MNNMSEAREAQFDATIAAYRQAADRAKEAQKQFKQHLDTTPDDRATMALFETAPYPILNVTKGQPSHLQDQDGFHYLSEQGSNLLCASCKGFYDVEEPKRTYRRLRATAGMDLPTPTELAASAQADARAQQQAEIDRQVATSPHLNSGSDKVVGGIVRGSLTEARQPAQPAAAVRPSAVDLMWQAKTGRLNPPTRQPDGTWQYKR